MKRSLIQLACAVAIGVLASSAQAVSTTSSTPPPSTSTDLKAQADSSYAAAKSVCEAKLGVSKRDCLRNAKADYDRWLRNGEVDESAAVSGGAVGAAGGMNPGGAVVKGKN